MQAIPPDTLKEDCTKNNAPDGTPYTLCRKIIQHIDFEVNGRKYQGK